MRTRDLEFDGARGGLIIYHGVMLKVELESEEDSTRLMEGLRRKLAESRSLVSGKARSTWFGLVHSGSRDAWNSASVGY